MDKTTCLLLALCAAAPLAMPHRPSAGARQGPHGGEALRAIGVASEKYIELVIKGEERRQELHVYGLDAEYKEMSLTQSGYGGLTLRWRDVELPLDVHKVDEAGHLSSSSESPQHYLAVGKFPRDASAQLDVTLAFPSKHGTGKATFRPFH